MGGRFQDADEPASYEFACRRSGIDVYYCAEPFVNDGTPMAAAMKGLKRAMAAEFSRELSNKVTLAQRQFAAAGYKQGGSAGYGLRRLLLSASGEPRRTLEFGERKGAPTDRVTYVRGPDHEVAVVRRIYAMYIDEKLAYMAIAERLNQEGLRTDTGRHWAAHNVKSILTREKYAGTVLFNQSTQKMRTTRRPNEPDKWIRHEGAFEGIVTRERFSQAAAERRRRQKRWSDDEMLDGLRDILVEHGRVAPELFGQAGLPAAKSYAVRFDGLIAAYVAAGVAGSAVSTATVTRYRSRCITKDGMHDLERCACAAGAQVERLGPRTYCINGVVVRLLCTRCRHERSHPCWKVLLRQVPEPDFIVWLRLDELNQHVAQVYLLPIADFPEHTVIWPSTRTLTTYDRYAHGSVRNLFGL